GWRVQENTIAYCLFVALHPPPGHSFSLERHTMQQLPASCPSIHVGLECICSREKLVGDTLCFLHHPDGSLTKDQSSYLLRTLCTRSYLDAEKVACWVQGLVHSAWMLLPQSHHWKLTLLPSSRSCRFQLTGMSKTNICTEIILAVRPSSSGTSCILA
ncbi:IPIL1 protein, partial [Alcedo cyanopectus]|nr:IPIL1 protein [Ceyx cyanopectus]